MAAQPHSLAAPRDDSLASLQDGAAQLLLIARIGERSWALPARAVERILRMAALTPLPDAPLGVAGVLNVHGAILPAVDPRPRLGLPTPPFHPDQHLVVVSAGTRYLFWTDRVERIVLAQPQDFDAVALNAERAAAPFLVRVDGDTIPVLSPEALDPGPLVQPTAGGAR
jgi:chemotaxis signal transduction protein